MKSDLLQRISERSGIPTENLEYARVSVGVERPSSESYPIDNLFLFPYLFSPPPVEHGAVPQDEDFEGEH